MEAISDISTELFYFVTVSVSSIGAACYESRSELTWLAAGAVIWMITEPIRGIGSRFVSEISTFALKWGLLAKLCVRRYCRYIRGPAVQGQPLRVKSWKMFEALLATPIVVLEARKARDDGLGRLLYKWADAFYEYWCVFLPESWTYARRVTSKYYAGTHVESHRTVARAWLLWQLLWTFGTLLAYAFFHGVLFFYELVEWACCGPPGLVALALSADYAFVDFDTGSERSGSSTNFSLAVGNDLLLAACLASRLRQRCDSEPGGHSLVDVAKKGYAEWCRALEEQEQAERLSDAFWRMDGRPDQPRPQVRTRSELHAEQRIRRAQREAERAADPRRGRRVSVGEDVPSWNGGRRLGTVDRSESKAAPEYSWSRGAEKDELWYGAY
ncbi:hypothetical protein PR003_g11697 [Phytophthora rubi]|uniref:Uncharacterized protein n=1 Tax=Phytophthora rubi TaxID=129364 RepID=A0A6A3M152_9STRA|nr:hypothetical protein PR002_g11258 [Phytophthora rubi]KAE9030899.1 hypothetical protein PR001_g11146 [Phytophthora rubi]KAE9338060.1 hypothetical protein PR003_g11697 [Phytophthora rubi]